MYHGEFSTWNRFLDINIVDGKIPSEEMHQRTLSIVYTDRDKDFDHIEWLLDNSDGMLTRPEYIAAGMLVQMRLGYADGAFPWKAFIINRIQGGMGVFGRGGRASIGDKEAQVTYYGRNRNAPGGRSSRPSKKTAKPPPKKPPKTYGATLQDDSFNEMLLQQKQGPSIIHAFSTSRAVEEIARRNGFEGDFAIIQPTQDQIDNLVIQAGRSDGETLQKLASRFGYIFKIEDNVLRWHSSTWVEAKYQIADTLDYGISPDIIQVSVDCDFTLPVPNKVTAKGFNWQRRRMEVYEQTREQAEGKINTATGVIQDLIDDQSKYNTLTRAEVLPVVSSSYAAVSGKGIKTFINKYAKAFQISVETVGNPKLLAARLLIIKGTGSPFLDNMWYITEARHTFDNTAYKTDIRLTFPPKNTAAAAEKVLRGEVNEAERDADQKVVKVGGVSIKGLRD